MKVKTLSIAALLLLTACAGSHSDCCCACKQVSQKDCDARVTEAINKEIADKKLSKMCRGSIVKNCNPSVFFDFNSAVLDKDSKESLDWVAEKLSKRRNSKIAIVGYADMVGEDEVNMEISRERAEAVRDYLLSKGVSKDRMLVGYRGNRSASSDPNMQSLERKVEIKFAKKEDAWYDDAYNYLDENIGYLFE